MNLENPDLDLIRRIHPECGFHGFMICFWICPTKRKIRFWIPKSGFVLSTKNAPLLSFANQIVIKYQRENLYNQ